MISGLHPRRLWLLVALLVFLSACSAPQSSFSGSDAAATAVPATIIETGSDAPPAATSTLAPLEPVDPSIPTEIPWDVLQATAVARATNEPQPTGEPARVQQGKLASATAQRGGLQIALSLSSDHFLAGEDGRAILTLHNSVTETLFADGPGVTLLDETGRQPQTWPWRPDPWSLPGLPYVPNGLAPGQSISQTVDFQLPFAAKAAGHSYTLWGYVRMSRAVADGRGSDNITVRDEAGPIQLHIVSSATPHQLQPQLTADDKGWRMVTNDPQGAKPQGPLWGYFEATSGGGSTSGPLRESPDGVWSGEWGNEMFRDSAGLTMRVWVAGAGYITGIASTTVNGGDTKRYQAPDPTVRDYKSLADANADFGNKLYQLATLPAGAQLLHVSSISDDPDQGLPTTIAMLYKLANGEMLRFNQVITPQPDQWSGWGQARSDPEAQQLMVGANPAYVMQSNGWRLLDWKIGDVGFELAAPVGALQPQDLLSFAGSAGPLP